ncbi:MAG: DUF4124 domain-containing protein [Burkholderiaceae bacterium]
MVRRFLVLALVLATPLSGLAATSTIYKWTDNAGKVHYSDRVPARYAKAAERIDVTPPDPAASRRLREAAREEAAHIRSLPRFERTVDRGVSAMLTVPAATGDPRDDDRCDASMRRYLESDRCFALYRLANGGVKAEAFRYCVPVVQPSCD